MPTLFPYLRELVAGILAGQPGVSQRRMFGCDVLFVADTMFVLFWKEGRIGVKLTDPADFARAMALPGAEQWKAGSKPMSTWVLVPEEMHDDPAALTPWVRRAYDLARVRAAAKTTGPAKTVAKAASAKKKPAGAAKKPARAARR